MSNADNASSRYGIDIRGYTIHAEANDLNEVFELLAIVSGRVHVTDRMSNALVFQGGPEDVRAAIRRSGVTLGDRVRR